jgi:hypothetical protein
MKVRELVDLLKGVNPDAEVVVDINGGTEYTLDMEETEEQNDPYKLKKCKVYSLIGFRY